MTDPLVDELRQNAEESIKDGEPRWAMNQKVVQYLSSAAFSLTEEPLPQNEHLHLCELVNSFADLHAPDVVEGRWTFEDAIRAIEDEVQQELNKEGSDG